MSAPWRAGWLRLVARRLGTAVPTLLGISLVTFALVHLTPGSLGGGGPGGSLSGTSSPEAEAQLRRLYGLDLPLFVNLDIQDRPRRARAALADLSSGDRAAAAARRLVQMGTLAWPEVFEVFAARPSLRARLRPVLDRVLGRISSPEASSLRAGPPERYLAWWRAHRGEYARRVVARGVSSWLAGGAPASLRRVRRFGKRAVGPLMTRLLSDDTGEVARARASQALSAVTGHVVLYDPAGPAPERRSALGAWRDWWRAERVGYQDLSTWARWTGALSHTRYGRWIGRLVAGDFGPSSYYRRRAWDVIRERLPVTLGLNLAALILAYLLAVPLGVFSAVRPGRALDRVVGGGALLLYSLPVYWVGLLLVLWLGDAGGLGWFPSAGLHALRPEAYPAGSYALDVLWHAVLPVFCLAYGAVAVLSRYQRASMGQALGQGFITAARAKGLSERRVVWRHGARNAVIPLISLLGLQIPYLVSGSVLVESIFDLPGIGSLTLTAIYQRDTNVLMGIVCVAALLTWVGLLLSDLLLLWADPRIALDRKEAL